MHRVKCGRAGELPRAQITSITQIDGGDFHVVTGKDDGTIVSWGDDSTGQACVPLGVTTAIQVSAANNAPNGNGDRLLDLRAPGYYVLSAVPNSTTIHPLQREPTVPPLLVPPPQYSSLCT